LQEGELVGFPTQTHPISFNKIVEMRDTCRAARQRNLLGDERQRMTGRIDPVSVLVKHARKSLDALPQAKRDTPSSASTG